MEQAKALHTIAAPTPRTTRYIVWGLGSIIALMIVSGFTLGLLALISSEGELNPFTHMMFLPFVTSVYWLVGILITLKYSRNAIGWLLLLVGLFSALTLIGQAYNYFEQYVMRDESSTISDFMSWMGRWVWFIPSFIPLTHILLLFPNGQLLSKRWQPLSLMAGLAVTLGMLSTALHPGSLPDTGLSEPNPYGIAGTESVMEFLLNIAYAFLTVGVFGAFASVVMRYRSASGVVRMQLKWLVFGVGIVLSVLVIFAMLWLAAPDNELILEASITMMTLGITVIIAVIGIAILRHQLWEIDVLINRTMVYGLMTAVVIFMYVTVVSFLSVLLDADNLLFSLIATGLVAVSFQSLRDLVQGWVNRLLFGERDEPYRALQRLAKGLEPVTIADEVTPAIVKTVAETLRLPYVAIDLLSGGHHLAAAAFPSLEAESPDTNTITIPLEYQSENIGQLRLAQRSMEESFSPAELDLLHLMARQVAIAVHNVRLTEDLQRSREQIVTTREEERRRLRRDLHDGLGPVLASMSFKLDAIQNLVKPNPEEAQRITGELKVQIQTALEDIRRIAYGLRPPALDELGLIGALREHLRAYGDSKGLSISFDVPDQLPPLAAAVEVAAYHIVLESVTNVVRHAQAQECIVRVALNGQLCVEIIDDGHGIPDSVRAGVGLSSIRERAAELGGSCVVESHDRGTCVIARLPLFENPELATETNTWI